MEKQIKALKELNEAAASMQVEFKKKLDTMKADGYSESKGLDMEDVMNYCYNMSSNISERISHLSDDMWSWQHSHLKGHIPSFKSASQLEKALKVLGLSDDFIVEKSHIYINASTNTLEAAYKK